MARHSQEEEDEDDDNLALFLDIPQDESPLLNHNSDDFEAPPGSEPGTSPIFKIPSSPTQHNGKNDYDWLLTPPDTSFISLLDMEPQQCSKILNGRPKACPAELKTKLTNWRDEPPSEENCTATQVSSPSPRSNSSSAGSCRPSSSGSQVSATFKSESPTEHHAIPLSTKSSRHVAPTLTTTLSSSKPMVANARSRTPTARTSTPTTRPTAPARKPISRSGTPGRYLSSALTVSSVSVLPGRSSSVGKVGPKATKNLAPSHGISTVKSRLQKPPEMPSFQGNAMKELRTSMTKRPVSTSRCRSGTPNSNGKLRQCSPSKELRPNRGVYSNGNPLPALRKSYSHDGDSVNPALVGTKMVERVVNIRSGTPNSNGKLRQCSPSKELCPNRGVYSNGNPLPALRRSYSHDGDNVNPALVGTKMVERVVNMRRLAPPKQDNQFTDSVTKKTSSHGSSGFGRTLSKSSLEMAMRHMDIGRTISGNSRPVMKKVTASSVYNVKSELAKIRLTGVSDSLATSSNASSELSLNSTPLSIDLSELDDDIGSEKS